MIFLKTPKKYVSFAAFGLSLVILIIGYVYPEFFWLNKLMCIISFLSLCLLVWQLSAYNHEDKLLHVAAFALFFFYVVFLLCCPQDRSLSNLQNYTSAAALCVTAIQFAHEDKRDKESDTSSGTKGHL